MVPNTIENVCRYARDGESFKIQNAIEHGIDINTLNIFGESPLACAVQHKQLMCIEFLLASGADPNLILAGGYTAVHIACRLGKLSILKLLVQKQGDLFLRDDAGLTPIYWAYSQYSISRRQKTLAYIDYLYPSALNELHVDRIPVKQVSSNAGLPLDIKTSLKSPRSPPLRHVTSDIIPIYPCTISDLIPIQGSIHYCVSQYVHVSVMSLNNQKVTCKYIDEQLKRTGGYSSSYNSLLQNEFEYIRRIQNFDNIIKCISVCYNKQIPLIIDYLIFEPIYRESLHFVLHKQHKYPKIRTISEILHAILSAVQYLHTERILHLNITSHAIYFTRHKQVKLGNFEYAVTWISNPLDQEIRDINYAVAADFYYEWLAPELFGYPHDNIRPTNKCDIYSIGVLLWELVQRKLPFKGYSKEQLGDFYRHQYQEGGLSLALPLNKYTMPAVFYRFLQSTLCLSPSERLSIDDLMELCNNWPVTMRYGPLDSPRKQSTSAHVTSIISTQPPQSVLNLLQRPISGLKLSQHLTTDQQENSFDVFCESQKQLTLGENNDNRENIIKNHGKICVKPYSQSTDKITTIPKYSNNYKSNHPETFPDTAVDKKQLVEEENETNSFIPNYNFNNQTNFESDNTYFDEDEEDDENRYSSSSSEDDNDEAGSDDYIYHRHYDSRHNKEKYAVVEYESYKGDVSNDRSNACVP